MPNQVTNPKVCGLRHLAFSVGNINDVVHYLNLKNIEVEAVCIDSLPEKKITFLKIPTIYTNVK